MDGRVVGTLAATLSLVVLGFVALGLFTSIGGLIIAASIAILVGTGASAIIEPEQLGRNVTVVVGYVAILALAYLIIGQMAAR